MRLASLTVSALGVTIDSTAIENPGNESNTNGWGAVSSSDSLATDETTGECRLNGGWYVHAQQSDQSVLKPIRHRWHDARAHWGVMKNRCAIRPEEIPYSER